MQWWREAKFGMFIHWGLYSILGRGEWVMAIEDIPVEEYEQLAKQFNPRPHAAREWARLAREAGMKYMVMTTKHHDGFCLFDSKFTDYCAPKQAARPRSCGRICGGGQGGRAPGWNVFLAHGLALRRLAQVQDRRRCKTEVRRPRSRRTSPIDDRITARSTSFGTTAPSRSTLTAGAPEK